MTQQHLTSRQADLLAFIRRSIEDKGFPPTFREIMLEMGMKSYNAVTDKFVALEKKGYIKRTLSKARAITLIDDELPDDDTEFDKLSDKISTLENQVSFYVTRADALQQLQSSMPEPWRTKVCNILANGTPD